MSELVTHSVLLFPLWLTVNNPSLYLPDLVRNVYSPDENQSSASDAIIGVLKRHNQNIDIIFLLVDCLNNISQSLDFPQPAGDKESKVDTTRVLKLVPEWSRSVLLPVLCSKLDLAVNSKNVLKIKACLFSICTSLVVRVWESLSHPLMHAIKRMIETVLLWPCLNADSVSKVQHGCIDYRIRAIGKKAAGDSVVTYVFA
ncbi:hypothetical protein QL285_088377 [Trifolium repens]|nr:hypothetical protein QL285_088377 [Trifolium repens]